MSAAETPLDVQLTKALTVVLGRSGVSDIEVGFLNDSPPYRCWAKGNWNGHRIYVENHANIDWALLDVARKVFHGGGCLRCHRTISFPHITPGHCSLLLVYR